MRAITLLICAILVAIGAGVAVEGATQPKVYALDGHLFSVAFPGIPSTNEVPARHEWGLEYHGDVVPPDFQVTFYVVGPAVALGQPAPAGYAVSRAKGQVGRPATLIDDVPATATIGHWTLPRFGNFSRSVATRVAGSGGFRVWVGFEQFSGLHTAYFVEAQSQDYARVRAFLESFTPI